MFPDSKIAEVFALSLSKVYYVISHGLAPSYKDKLLQNVIPQDSHPPYFVACFDEAFNDVLNLKQLDVHLIYFDKHLRKTQRMYFNSHFVGHACASDLLTSFTEILKDLDYVDKLGHVSMDGPNVNWSFLNNLVAHRKEENANAPDLINIGSCGLHVTHGSFGTGLKKTDWNLAEMNIEVLLLEL